MFLLLWSVLLPSVWACDVGDREISVGVRTEEILCEAPGYCRAWDYHPRSGEWEYFYGYHQNCRGTQQRAVHEQQCLRSRTGEKYTVRDEGNWGYCQIP